MGLVDQLRIAQIARGISVRRLLAMSGLRIHRTVLQRKLSGQTPVTTRECEAVARALGITVIWPWRLRQRSKRA